jgi:hypothetical protein
MTTGQPAACWSISTGRTRLAGEWDHLVARPRAGRRLTWAWVGAWLDTLGRDADLEVVSARDPIDGRLLGVAPFFVETRRRAGVGYRSLRLVGNGPGAPDHLDMLVRADEVGEVAPLLWDAVTRNRRWDVIDLDGVASDGTLAATILRRHDDRQDSSEPCPISYRRRMTPSGAVAGPSPEHDRYRRKLGPRWTAWPAPHRLC